MSIINEPFTAFSMLSVILSMVSLTPGGTTKLPPSPHIGGVELESAAWSNKLKEVKPITLFLKSSNSLSICFWHSSSVKPPDFNCSHLESLS